LEISRSDGSALLVKRLNGGLAGIGFDGADVWVAGYVHDLAFKL
jgi:hypothetical protein